jgi:hypothetical protein
MLTRLLASLHFDANDLAGFAFGHDIERAATNFAIGCKALVGKGCIQHKVELRPAEWTLDRCGTFHKKEGEANSPAIQSRDGSAAS